MGHLLGALVALYHNIPREEMELGRDTTLIWRLYAPDLTMATNLEVHSLPRLETRAPMTTGPVLDVDLVVDFANNLVKPTGAHDPTVLLINLEGRFLSATMLYELLVPLSGAIVAGAHGSIALVVATPDPALADVIRAIAHMYKLPLFLTTSKDEIGDAEPLGPLTPSDLETLQALKVLGGRASVSMVAQEAGIDHKAAGNRLSTLDDRHMVLKVNRPRRQGDLFLDPRVAIPVEEPSHPASGDYGVAAPLLADIRALAEMQGSEPEGILADAWQEFLTKHVEQLSIEHREVAEMMKAGNKQGVAEYTSRHAATRARKRARKPAN
jgi:hypothetical protein